MILAAAYITKTLYIKEMITDGVMVNTAARKKFQDACTAEGRVEK
jgi:hypothetical protein